VIRSRIAWLMLGFLTLFLFLTGVIAYYQLYKGEEIAREAAAMRNKKTEIQEYSRGAILDCNHLPLTESVSAYALYCLPGDIKLSGDQEVSENKRLSDAAKVIGSCLNKEPELIYKQLIEGKTQGRGIIRIASDLKPQEIQKINGSNLSGVIVAPVLKRYRGDGFCAHLIGYVGKAGDNTGKAGLERLYNSLLEGSDTGQEIVSVQDARGITIQGLMFRIRQDQQSQKSCLVLTIDSRVQELVEKVMNKQVQKGAVVVMDVDSKEVLAMASRPTFNPYADMQDLISHDQNSSLTNRALSRYHPGSLFKILVAAAALEEKAVDVDDIFECNGSYRFNEELAISCWQESGHGKLGFAEAFANSCNPAFIEIGLNLNQQILMDYARKMHLTDETLIGYSKDKEYSYVNIAPVKPAIANACLGQQGVMLTPLQICSLIATIADDGRWAPPSIVRYTVDKQGNRKEMAGIRAKEQVISKKTAQTIQEIMGA
jgi:penicillin-binding protein 2